MSGWRKMTWVVVGYSAFVVFLAIAAGASGGGGSVGAGIGAGFILSLGFWGFVVLAIIWFMTRPRAEPVQSAPAGWYPDPWRQASLRWWDGAGWTGHVSGPTAST